MRAYLFPLLQLQRFFVPALTILLVWAVWRTVFRRDSAVGLALYLGLVVIVDGFLNTGIYLPGFEVGSVRYSEVCAVFLLINRPPGSWDSGRRTISWVLSAYFGLLFLSVLRADSVLVSVFDFRRLIVPQIIALLVTRRGFRSGEDYRRFFLWFTAFVIIIGLFTFWDVFFDRWLLKSEVLDHPIYAHNRELGRFGSFFLNPNYLGGFVVLVFPPLFIWTLNEPKIWLRRCGWGGLLSLVFCLVETQSRGPLIAFAFALVLLVLGPCGGRISRRRRLGFLAVFVMLFALAMPGFFLHAVERFTSLNKETTAEQVSRQTIWRDTLTIIADHPLAGIGFGEDQFVKITRSYGVNALDNPHNSYLQMTVYAGVPCLVAFLFANGALLTRAVRYAARGLSAATPTVFGLATGIAGFLASAYPDMHLFTQTVAPVYWVCFALLLSLVTSVSEPSGEAQAIITQVTTRGRGEAASGAVR